MNLDSLPRRGEDPRDFRAAGGPPGLQLPGDPPVPPGQPVVIGEADIAVLHLVFRFQPCRGFEETGMRPRGVEHEDPSGFGIDEEARVAVAVKPDAGAHHLLAAPRPPAVGTAAQQEIDRARQVIKIWTAIVGGQDGALQRDGQGRDPVLPVSSDAADRKDVFHVGIDQRYGCGFSGLDVGCHTSSVGVGMRGRKCGSQRDEISRAMSAREGAATRGLDSNCGRPPGPEAARNASSARDKPATRRSAWPAAAENPAGP